MQVQSHQQSQQGRLREIEKLRATLESTTPEHEDGADGKKEEEEEKEEEAEHDRDNEIAADYEADAEETVTAA